MLWTSVILLAAAVSASPVLEARTLSCNHDGLLRCLIATPSLAMPFCSSYITIPVSTSYIATVTPTVTATATESDTVTTATSTTVVSTEIDTVTATVDVTSLINVKRTASIPPPKCVTSATSYPASRISSACSCLTIAKSIVSVTSTASASTITITQSTTVSTQTNIITISSASTTSATVTTTSITSTTSTTSLTLPTGKLVVSGSGTSYDGTYLQSNTGENSGLFAGYTSDVASTYSLDSAGHFIFQGNDFEGNTDAGSGQVQYFYLNSVTAIEGSGFSYIICTTDSTGVLSCTQGDENILQVCSGSIYIGAYLSCPAVTLTFV